MNTFFAIIKADKQREYVVTIFTRDNLLSLVENDFGKAARALCENAPESQAIGMFVSYLEETFESFRLFPQDLNGALTFLSAAHNIGVRQELEAIKQVEYLRNALTNAIDNYMDIVRSAFISRMGSFKWDSAADHVKEVARIATIGRADLEKFANLHGIL